MMKFGLLLLILVLISLALVILTLFAVNDHDDDAIYLDRFISKCSTTPKSKELIEREFDLLRYRISDERFKQLYRKFKNKFE